MNASCTSQELLDAGRSLRIKAIVTSADAAHRLELDRLRQELGCELIYLAPKETGPAGLFELSAAHPPDSEDSEARPYSEEAPAKLHGLNDYSLILHTSGTSGKKKVVPYTLRSLIIGTLAVIKSWELREDDVDSECSTPAIMPIGLTDTIVNMMPLFHVGGIVRNLWAPIFSGGGTIMCAGFDPSSFWTIAQNLGATWFVSGSNLANILTWSISGIMPHLRCTMPSWHRGQKLLTQAATPVFV